jgi:prevent-host-death family protein
MTKVGIRELKAHLSEYLRKVRKGETLSITDHGEEIALLQPAPASENPTLARMRAMAGKGMAILPKSPGGKPKGLKTPIRLPKGKSVSAAILEDRR